MKQTVKNIIIVWASVAAISLQSCYTNRPIARNVSSPDYNKRVNVSGAQYKKKGNAMNVVFNVGLIGGGAYAGYNTNLVQQQTANGKEPVKAANAAIGALAGASIAYLIDQIAGKNSISTVKDPTDWIRKANKEYRLLNSNSRGFDIIHSSVERKYTVRNINDIYDYKTAFPHSSYTDEIFLQGIKTLKREELPLLVEAYPENKHIHAAKIQYIESSVSLTDAVNAMKKYPLADYNAEPICLKLIATPDDAILFLKEFSMSVQKKISVANAFTKGAPSKSEMDLLKNNYGQDLYLTEQDLASFSNTIKRNYFNGLYAMLVDPYSSSSFDKFNEDYVWLNYQGKNEDILSKYWDLMDFNYSKGDDVLRQYGSILSKPVYKKINITRADLLNVANDKLRVEAEKNIKILNVQNVGSTNEEWEKWKKESGLSARLVTFNDRISYIIYGEVENKSKFDLPVIIQANGTLKSVQINRVANWLDMREKGFSIVGAMAEILAAGQPAPVKELAKTNTNFYLPNLPAHEKSIYAARVDFGEQQVGGMVVWGLIRVEIELFLDNLNISASYYTKDVSTEQLKKQVEWQKFALYGLPASTAKLMDHSLDYYRWASGKESSTLGKGVALEQTQGVYDMGNVVLDKINEKIVEIMASTPSYSESGNSDCKVCDNIETTDESCFPSCKYYNNAFEYLEYIENKDGEGWIGDINNTNVGQHKIFKFSDGIKFTLDRIKINDKIYYYFSTGQKWYYDSEANGRMAYYIYLKCPSPNPLKALIRDTGLTKP
jgi:hypothetical protein